MAAVDAQDGSEDVTDFLRRIKELGDKRDREDEERTRKLEEDLLESRRQREARRVERARSISPEKRSPSTTPRSIRSDRNIPNPREVTSPSARAILSPTRSHPRTTAMERKKPAELEPDSPSSPDLLPKTHDVNPSSTRSNVAQAEQTVSNGPRRNNTLSWQQRPTSLSGPRSRPASSVQTSSPVLSSPEPSQGGTREVAPPSRTQIAETLGSKDPLWFRQTADRGKGSPALLKGENRPTSDLSESSRKQQLHGLSLETLSDAGQSSPLAASSRTSAPRREGSPVANDHTIASMLPPARMNETERQARSSGPEPAQSERRSGSPNSVLRHSRERSASPTKGIGGFVQSAMLRRTESVNKRWSAQKSTGLSRQDSTSSFKRPESTDGNRPKEASSATDGKSDVNLASVRTPDFRPSSPSRDNSRSGTSEMHHSTDSKLHEESAPAEQVTPPSPSKRWSPLKSSWLESALTKPESPKTSSQPQQPTWLSDLHRNKQQKASKGTDAVPTHNVEVEGPKPLPKPSRLFNHPAADALTPSSKKSTDLESQPADLISPTDSTRAQASDRKEPALDVRDVSVKKKPNTPPKKDLRSSLKPRQDSPTKQQDEGPEFLNAFGKLKRAKTENYVAPDELKNNILRGKAGLSLTNGPQPSQRKDEFKESLLQQKASMKNKAADPPSRIEKKHPPDAVPEALAKRKALAHTDGNAGEVQLEERKETKVPLTKASSAPAANTGVSKSTSKLAGKLNPSLANIIARGPVPTSNKSETSASTNHVSDPSTVSGSHLEQTPKGSSASLEHMTKSRARGPKRRAPKASTNIEKTSDTQDPSTPTAAVSKSKPTPRSSSRNVTPTTPAFTITHQNGKTQNSAHSTQDSKSSSPFGTAPPPSAFADTKPTMLASESVNEKTAHTSPVIKASKPLTSKVVKTPSRDHELTPSQSQFSEEDSRPSVRNATARSGQTVTPEVAKQPAKSPIRLPTHEDEAAATAAAGLDGESPVEQEKERKSEEDEPKTTAFPRETKPPQRRIEKHAVANPSMSSSKVTNGEVRDATSSVTKSKPSSGSATNDDCQCLRNFLGAAIPTPCDLTIDVEEVLSAEKPHTFHKIKTLRKEMKTINSDGKTNHLPPNQEHVLCSTNMYLCTHVFGDATGARKTEVYLWSGSQVSSSAVEDAQLFAKQAAKDASGTLHTFKQGQEPSNFFQALGGIVITRRNSSSGPFLLCGRNHLGHVAFDEVQFSLDSFCSGFPYIVCAQASPSAASSKNDSIRPSSSLGNTSTARIYLWKGAGCNAEELGCARLVSMDMDPTATIEELDEGKESKDFLSLFSSFNAEATAMSTSIEHWKLKASQANYYTRLYRVSHSGSSAPESNSRPSSSHALAAAAATTSSLWNAFSRRGSQPSTAHPSGQRITELTPYTQQDLTADPSAIHILDAFFTIYILLGPESGKQREALATAMAFTQEYAILAAGKEERPKVPTGVVVVRGVPREAKACFRAWDEDFGVTGKRKEEMVVEMPLSAVIAAAGN